MDTCSPDARRWAPAARELDAWLGSAVTARLDAAGHLSAGRHVPTLTPVTYRAYVLAGRLVAVPTPTLLDEPKVPRMLLDLGGEGPP